MIHQTENYHRPLRRSVTTWFLSPQNVALDIRLTVHEMGNYADTNILELFM